MDANLGFSNTRGSPPFVSRSAPVRAASISTKVILSGRMVVGAFPRPPRSRKGGETWGTPGRPAARPLQSIRLSQNSQKLPRLIVEPRKHLIERLVSQMLADGFAEHLAEIGGEGEIASFIELMVV